VRAADLLPRLRLPPLSTLLPGRPREAEIARLTGLSRQQWRDLGRAFPRLGSDPGPEAARARRRLRFLVGRALRTARHAPRFDPAVPEPAPALYLTAHLGDLRSLRYLLRRFIPVATVVGTSEQERRAISNEDREFDERAPCAFPHAFSAARPHALRSALSRGSLIAAADLPAGHGIAFPCLGGWLPLDPRPFRLARLAGAPCRPLFLTAPRGVLTITVGRPLPQKETAALEEFARALDRATDQSPLDLDGPTWWNRLERP
jgi:hypothetical protein